VSVCLSVFVCPRKLKPKILQKYMLLGMNMPLYVTSTFDFRAIFVFLDKIACNLIMYISLVGSTIRMKVSEACHLTINFNLEG